jgi:hypothetical protein
MRAKNIKYIEVLDSINQNGENPKNMDVSYKFVEVDKVGNLHAGTQIAVKKSAESLHSSFRFFYPFLSKVRYYYHHGVYLGQCNVVHFAGQNRDDAKPRKSDIFQFWKGAVDGKLCRVQYNDPSVLYSTEVTLALANQVLTRPEKWPGFQLANYNCESFATWLKTGENRSAQLIKAIVPLAVGVSDASF